MSRLNHGCAEWWRFKLVWVVVDREGMKDWTSFKNCSFQRLRVSFMVLRDRLERFQRRALKIIIRKPIFQHCDHNDLLLTLNQASLQSRRHFQSALVGFHLANQTAPPHLQEVCYPRASVDHSLRHHNFFQLPKANSTLFQSSPLYFASHIFNILPKHIQSSTRLSEFKKKAQQYFLSPSCPCSMHALTST